MEGKNRQFDLGIITKIKSGVAEGVVLTSKNREKFKIKFRSEVGTSLQKYMVLGITKDHQNFLYEKGKKKVKGRLE